MTKTDPSHPQTLTNYLDRMDKLFTEYLLNKAPAVPDKYRLLLVKFFPYIALATVVFSLPAIFVAFGIGAVISPFAYLSGVKPSLSFIFTGLFILASAGLILAALPGLFARRQKSWKLTYYSVLLSAVHSLLSFNLGSLIFGTAISLYLLYQIRGYYR